MRVRGFREGDTDGVVELWEACGLTRAWNDPRKDIARKLSVQREMFLVVEAEGADGGGVGADGGAVGADGGAARIVGSVMAGFEGHRGWVNYLAVAPELRGRGIARGLMAEVERMLLERGCPKINLQIREGNDAVLAFYRALGYEPDRATSLGKRLIADD